MFKRRDKISIFSRIRDFFWPQSGWKRSFHYLFHRLARLPGTPYSIAAGFASGAAISFTPFVGLHFVLGGVFAYIIRANILSSAIGTAVGNPWTFPFIWVWIYKAGRWMGASSGDEATLDFIQLFVDITESLLRRDFDHLAETVWPIWWPMFLGSLPTALAVWFIFFFPLKYLISSYQITRVRRRVRKHLKEIGADRSS